MRKNYLIVLVLFSILLGGCSYGKINEGRNTNTQDKVQSNSVNTGNQTKNQANSINTGGQQMSNSDQNSFENNNLSGKDILSGINDPLNLLHLENSGKHLLSAGTYLLKDSLVLNQKIFKSIQEFQKLGSGLTEIEKNALQKTLINYQKNLELQKEMMNSFVAKEKCIVKIHKPKQETTKPKQETTKSNTKSNGF